MDRSAEQILDETSRTFAIPIRRLPDRLREAVASAYLCMRSIDEIEDRRGLDASLRAELLRGVSRALQAAADDVPATALATVLAPRRAELPEVTLRLAEWLALAPPDVRARVADATAAMADRMADWVACGFAVRSEADLDRYTYAVAGAVGLLLADLWAWHAGVRTDRTLAVGFGRGLQAVNILRNRTEDLAAGVDFFPDGWGVEPMHQYARRNLGVADRYAAGLPAGPIREFCAIPLALAHATLDALAAGRTKLTRDEVVDVVGRASRG